MKNLRLSFLRFALGFIGFACVVQAQTPVIETGPLPMAVFDFKATEPALEKKGGEIAVLLNTWLSLSPDVFLVERQEIEKILAEQEAGISGVLSSETVARVGALVGAKVLVTGRVFESGGKMQIVAKIMSTETGRVFGELVTAKDTGSIDPAVEQLAVKISALVKKQAGALAARIEDPAARVERLKKLVAGKKLLAVYVSIPEQHLARPVIDPAAQTELQKVLQDVGFEVVAQSQLAGRTDVAVIAGEAFSEFGMRRGNLISCRARVEITVKDSAGKLLAADRQMDVAVDIAEHIAGKKALENAALKLADRVVAKLAASAQ